MENNIEEVLADDLGEGYRIIGDSGELTPAIAWVDWITDPETDEVTEVCVNFDDNSTATYPAGTKLRQIWHEDAA